jgi:hypothetical protein
MGRHGKVLLTARETWCTPLELYKTEDSNASFTANIFYAENVLF